jgi:SAM-dependent methyltransferase
MSEDITLKDYWNRRGSTYEIRDIFGRRILKAYLDKHFKDVKSAVDGGTGKGELLPLLQDVPDVVGLDFSEEMMSFARERAKRHEWKNVRFVEQDLTKGRAYPLKGDKFDLFMCRTVLMHIAPKEVDPTSNIEMAAENISQMSDNLLLLELWDDHPMPDLAPHNWIHDYHNLFKNLGYKVAEAYRRPDLPQVCFVFKR